MVTIVWPVAGAPYPQPSTIDRLARAICADLTDEEISRLRPRLKGTRIGLPRSLVQAIKEVLTITRPGEEIREIGPVST